MARTDLNIGPVPAGEECAQLGSRDYYERAQKECRAFVRQLKREFPDGTFKMKACPHDFGTYYDVFAYFDDGPEESLSDKQVAERKAAFDAEADCPEYWDEQALQELGIVRPMKGTG